MYKSTANSGTRLYFDNSFFFLLPIAGAEIILGAAWLATLGAHIVDYSKLSIHIYHNGQFITLQGDKEVIQQQVSLHQLNKLSSSKSIAESYELYPTNQDNSIDINANCVSTMSDETQELKFPEDMLDTLRELLLKYRQVFFYTN